MASVEDNSNQPEENGDVLIAQEKVKNLRRDGILINTETPYSHTSTRGGAYRAFLPQRIKSGTRVVASLLIFIIIIMIVESARKLF